MWNKFAAALLLAACFAAVTTQDVTVNCEFRLSIFQEYSCLLEGVAVLDPSVNVIFGGTHAEGRGNDDVEIIHILNSQTPFMIPQMFATFPNVVELTIESSELQSINVPEEARLTWLDIIGNNISRVESGSIRNQTDLLSCYLHYNGITEIDENAFTGMPNLLYMVLSDNLITEFAPRTFDALPEVIFINFVENLVTRIEAELFSQNTKLGSLYMSFNRIDEISPRFADSFRDNANYISLVDNVCTDHHFAVTTEAGWNEMTSDLQTCFDNFNNRTSSDARRITMVFSGPLTIYDEFENVLLRL